MNASNIFRALGISGLLLAVTACDDFTGQDPSNERREVTEQECFNMGGTSTVNPENGQLVCAVPAAGASAAGAAGVPTGAIVAGGAALVAVFAIANSNVDSSSGTR